MEFITMNRKEREISFSKSGENKSRKISVSIISSVLIERRDRQRENSAEEVRKRGIEEVWRSYNLQERV